MREFIYLILHAQMFSSFVFKFKIHGWDQCLCYTFEYEQK